MPVLSLSCLGMFQATLDEEPLYWGRNEKDLLAYLAVETLLHDRRSHPRSRLGELLWPDSQKPNVNFNKAWHDLQHPTAAIDCHGLTAFLGTDGTTVYINGQANLRLDLVTFNSLVSSSHVADWERGLNLYRGDFLADFARSGCDELEVWHTQHRQMFHQRFVKLLQQLADHYLTVGLYAQAEEIIHRYLQVEPTDEMGFQLSMKLLALCGQRAAALARYQECCAMLRDEYGAEPNAEIVTLHQQILQGLFPPPTGPSQHTASPHHSRPSPSSSTGTGVIDVDPTGLRLIQGYDLWFTSKATGRWQIWHLETSTGALAPVHFDLDKESQKYEQFVPAIAPDGQRIVFSAGLCLPSGRCVRNLYIANVDGTDTRRLTASALDEYHPAWAPRQEQARLAYHAGIAMTDHEPGMDFGIWVMDVASRQAHQLTDRMDYDPVWSPDGAYLAYHSLGTPHTIKVLAYQEQPCACNQYCSWTAVSLAYDATSPAWLNDHALLFTYHYQGKWDLFRIPVAEQKEDYVHPIQLTHNAWDNLYPAVFDGRLLLWQAFHHEPTGNEGYATDRQAELWVMDLVEQVETPLITGIGNMRDGILVPHPTTLSSHNIHLPDPGKSRNPPRI